ncbi:unnamed protein product [Camellia sinensis]
MTTLEKLFVQVFDRKNRIIEQVNQRSDLYTRHLVSKLLIDGITPPSWLWNPKFDSQSSDPKGLEIVLSRPPSDCSMSVKRNFDDGEKCSLNETFNPIMEKERLDKSSGKRCTVVKSATSLDKVTFDDPCRKSLEMQSLEQEVSNKREEPRRVSFETCVEECVVVDEEVSELDINKNLQNAVIEIQHFPFSHKADVALLNVDKGPGVEMHQKVTCHIAEGFESSPRLQVEELCKSASRHTPLPEFSATFKLHGTPDLYQSVPNGLLEHMDLRSTLNLNDDGGKELRASYICVDEVKCAFEGVLYSDCVPYTDARFGWSFKKPYMSPIGKLWDRISSNSSSSGKQRSLNPELACFPIEEDPSISGENENIDEVADTIQEDISSTLMTRAKRQPLAEIKEACVNPRTSVSAAERFPDRNSLDSTNTEVSATGAQSRIKQKLGNRYSNKRRCTNEAKENRSLSVSTNCIKKATESLNNRFSKPKLSGKTSLRKGGQNLLERESKRNNIVSNITSFLPLVQQKQAAAVGTGKRDIKVKALEAAEAAKHLEEKRQNERNMKKDALKLERERKEQENLRQMEINKKKKEEEQKKKDADMAARKRLREEEERKEKERKRKRIEEPRQQQRGKEEKLRAGKEKEVPFGAMDENVNDGKESNNELRKHQKMKKPQTDPRAAEISTSNASQVILEDCQAFSHFGDNGEKRIALWPRQV